MVRGRAVFVECQRFYNTWILLLRSLGIAIVLTATWRFRAFVLQRSLLHGGNPLSPVFNEATRGRCRDFKLIE